MKNLFTLSIAILLASCSSSEDNTKQVQKFILEKETGFKWGTLLTCIFSEMNIKKDISVSKRIIKQLVDGKWKQLLHPILYQHWKTTYIRMDLW